MAVKSRKSKKTPKSYDELVAQARREYDVAMDLEVHRVARAAKARVERTKGRALRKLLAKGVECEKETQISEYLPRYDVDSNGVWESRMPHTGCGRHVPKSDCAVVSVVDYGVAQISSDCGYGDCDEFAVVKTRKWYWVCPRCKTMHKFRFEELESGPSWTRNMSSEDERARGLAFTPQGWRPLVRMESSSLEKFERKNGKVV